VCVLNPRVLYRGLVVLLHLYHVNLITLMMMMMMMMMMMFVRSVCVSAEKPAKVEPRQLSADE